MEAARCRMAGEGEFENEWNRLLGFKRARVSTEGPAEVEAALCVNGADDGVLIVGVLPGALFPCSGELPPRERLLRSEPKLRIHDGETAHLRRE